MFVERELLPVGSENPVLEADPVELPPLSYGGTVSLLLLLLLLEAGDGVEEPLGEEIPVGPLDSPELTIVVDDDGVGPELELGDDEEAVSVEVGLPYPYGIGVKPFEEDVSIENELESVSVLDAVLRDSDDEVDSGVAETYF